MHGENGNMCECALCARSDFWQIYSRFLRSWVQWKGPLPPVLPRSCAHWMLPRRCLLVSASSNVRIMYACVIVEWYSVWYVCWLTFFRVPFASIASMHMHIITPERGRRRKRERWFSNWIAQFLCLHSVIRAVWGGCALYMRHKPFTRIAYTRLCGVVLYVIWWVNVLCTPCPIVQFNLWGRVRGSTKLSDHSTRTTRPRSESDR